MKKKILLLGKKICFFTFLFLGIGISAAFGVEKLHYGDTVNIQGFNKLYATQDGNIFAGRKDRSDKASFIIVADIDNPDSKKGDIIKYGNSVYFQSAATRTPTFIGDSGEQKLIYKMQRHLLGLVTSVEKNKIYKFAILPSTGKKDGQPVYYGEKINLQYKIPTSKSPIKYFRFTTGGKVFGSDDSKLMTKTQIKETKELTFEKVQGVSAAKPTKPAEKEKKITYYDVLGIDKNTDSKAIVKKCRQILLKILPDKVASEEKEIAGEATKVINAANDVLSNYKSTYDGWLKQGGRAPAGLNIIEITPDIYNFIKEKIGQGQAKEAKSDSAQDLWAKGKAPAKERASGPKIGSRESAVDCPICLETLVEGDDVAVLSCNPKHIFHKNCIEDWLKRDKTCPICRAENVRIAKIYKLK